MVRQIRLRVLVVSLAALAIAAVVRGPALAARDVPIPRRLNAHDLQSTPEAVSTERPLPTMQPDGTLKTATVRLLNSTSFHFVLTINAYHAVGDAIRVHQKLRFTLDYTGNDQSIKALHLDGEWIVITPAAQTSVFYHKQADRWVILDIANDLNAALQMPSLLEVTTALPLQIGSTSVLLLGNSFQSTGQETIADQITTHYMYTADDNTVFEAWLDTASGDIVQLRTTAATSTPEAPGVATPGGIAPAADTADVTTIVFSHINEPLDIQAPATN
ncbi:MAG TPA: hypothetical protein VMT34_03885 [Aggregatilineales bacterium]|nr:hypothetical protein [Aggregatilineales bacterium]